MNPQDVPSHEALLVDGLAETSAPLPRLIAYLSLCMLAAAFGAMVGPTWCHWWAIFGTFGLASAIGLDFVNRSRARLAARIRASQLALKAEQKLQEMLGDLESFQAIRAALRRFQPVAGNPTTPGPPGGTEPRLPVNKPATIFPLCLSSEGAGDRLGRPLTVRLRNISSSGFGLAHDQRLERGPVLLECRLDGGAPLRFLGEVLWCELQADGCYFSGGKLLDVADARTSRRPIGLGPTSSSTPTGTSCRSST